MKRSLVALAITLSSARPVIAQVPAGPEFLVNTGTSGWQEWPTVAITHDGFVVTWSSNQNAPPDYDVFGQVMDRRGVKVGSEFRINTFTPGRTMFSDVAALPGGRFVVAWESAGVDGFYSGVAARVFTGPGAPLTGEIVANTYTTGSQTMPSIASDGAGNFVVVWNSFGQDGDGWGVFGRRFSASGAGRGAEFRVNTTTAGTQFAHYGRAAAMDAAGRFVVVWDGDGHVHGQRFDADGARVGTEFQVDVGAGSHAIPAVDASPDGGFVVAWTGANRVRGRRYASDGTPVGSQLDVSASFLAPSTSVFVGSDDAGNMAFAWSTGGSPSGSSVVRRFAADGSPRGPETPITTASAFRPAIEADSIGNLVAVWYSDVTVDIWGRRFGGLVPRALVVDAGANNVLEPGETVDVRPSWHNENGAALTIGGALSPLTGPAGATYATVDATAGYGTVADAATAMCTDCYAVSVSAPPARPATHWDAEAVETITPGALGQAQRWRLHVGESFADVPRGSPFYRFVETLLHRGVTAGCTTTAYCPADSTMRAEMAVFVLVAREGAGYLPPTCGAPVFDDVPAASPFCPWIEELARRGVVAGCGGGSFCPGDPVTREQMAVYVLRTREPAVVPPPCAAPMFADVPPSSPFCRWVEELARRGVVAGCGGGNYCPAAAVTREQMGVFISVTFGLALYGP